MTEQLPRRITASEIMVKDGVRAEVHRCNYREIHEGLVTDLFGSRSIQIGCIDGVILSVGGYDWTLINRPEPTREVGSRWEDPETGARYLLDDDGDYIRYRKGSDDSDSVLYADRTFTPQIFARLIPLDGV